ncbi:MAG: DUF4150 domain-containing protein [Paracoccus sp. (in: a-proteobacteria)]|nr:DUF4150 domain-containing protein [Paracoccus sp. (in: a-proteobacteria)]
MTETVRINGLTLCHKGASGLTVSTIPDVCRSPGTPIPYVNVAYARDLADGSVTVKSHGGEMCGVRGSRFARSFGDEPGRGKGVSSQTVQDEATWLSWSPDVYIEDRAATRLSDRMLMNKGNAASLAGYNTPPITGGNPSYDLMCSVGCACYAKLRPRNAISRGADAIDQVIAPVDEDRTPGRYQRCVDESIRLQYPNTVLGPTIVGADWVNDGYLSEVGFWDPTNPNNVGPFKSPGQVIIEGGAGAAPQRPRRAPWGGYKWFSVSGSRWLDVVRVQNGQMTEMYDMKFPGDRANNADKDLAYRTIAARRGASYEEFWVLEQCDDCTDAIEDYERAREESTQRTLRAIGEGLRNGPPLPLPLPGPGPRLPRPVRP